MVTCPRPPVFARPNILVASFATQAVVASFATQARACILSDHNIFYTPRGGGNGGVMPLGLFLFLIIPCVHCLLMFYFYKKCNSGFSSRDEDVNILTICFVLFLYRAEVTALVLRSSRSIDRSIDRLL